MELLAFQPYTNFAHQSEEPQILSSNHQPHHNPLTLSSPSLSSLQPSYTTPEPYYPVTPIIMSSTALSPNSTGKLSLNHLRQPPIQSYRVSKLTLFPLSSFSHRSKSLYRPQTPRPGRRRSQGTVLPPPYPLPSPSPNPSTLLSQILANSTNEKQYQPCCVCKDEKASRDDCMLFSNSDNPQEACQSAVEKYRNCMRGFGFSVP